AGPGAPAVAHSRGAVAMKDARPNMDPPSCNSPPRQSLGAALLPAGRAGEAEAVYRRDLEDYPHNGWSMFGLAESLAAQGRTDEAAEVREMFAHVWARADVELTGSRF